MRQPLQWSLTTDRGDVPVGTHGCWEEHGVPVTDAGPYVYTCRLARLALAPGDRVLLRFGAVSYACTVSVDGVEVAEHRGMWDAFSVDITDGVRADSPHEIAVTVEKPASLTAGPDSAYVPGRYPTREVLAGFLPYVWGHVHGGIWQPVELEIVPDDGLLEVDAYGIGEDRIAVTLETRRPTRLLVTVTDPSGTAVASAAVTTSVGEKRAAGGTEIVVPQPQTWSPSTPGLYRVQIRRRAGGTVLVERSIGLRAVGRFERGSTTLLTLNGQAVYPRLALSWGWFPDRLMPDPGPERVREDLLRLRSMGFNGVKLCLWFPPDYYFEVADSLGMLVWVELPLWIPVATDGLAEQARDELTRLVRQARRHACVVIYSLGCELGAGIDGGVLRDLWHKVKRLVGDVPVCDNSGSGEAYGGADEALTDFYDHHLYVELQHLGPLFDYFAPGWRPRKPWLFGEFCDYDTLRVPPPKAWWSSPQPAVNPQGARWQFDTPWLTERLARSGWSTERLQQVTRLSQRRALLHRKVTLEHVRSRPDTSGYVITAERDTPISTSGLLDDSGAPKIDPAVMSTFNNDTVLCVAPVRRRGWQAGGDRPAPPDQWCRPADSILSTQVILAHARTPSLRALCGGVYVMRAAAVSSAAGSWPVVRSRPAPGSSPWAN